MLLSPERGRSDPPLPVSQCPESAFGGSKLSIGSYLSSLAGHATPSSSVSTRSIQRFNGVLFFSYSLPGTEPGPAITALCSDAVYVPVWMAEVGWGAWKTCLGDVAVQLWSWFVWVACGSVAWCAHRGDFSKEDVSGLRPGG